VFWGSGVDGWTLFERPAVRLWQILQVPTKGCNHAETSTSSGCEGLLHPVVVDCGLGSCKMGVLPSIIACPWALSPAIHLRVAVRFLGQCV
jgi:hypothetical protein